MKVAVCAHGEGINAQTDLRFGRCPYFIIVDSEEEKLLESISNHNVEAQGGAGPQSAQLLAGRNVEAVITGNLGPKAEQALRAAGIYAYCGAEGTVKDAIHAFKEDNLKLISNVTVPAHYVMRKGRR